MSRPTNYNATIIKKIAEALAPQVHQWLNDPGTAPDDVQEDLAGLLTDESDWGAYNLAKTLDDNHYYDVDERLFNILGNVEGLQHKFHDDTIKEWVQNNDVQPQMVVGNKVKVKRWRHDTVFLDGEIVTVDRDRAEYRVHHNQLGQYSVSQIYPYELVEEWNK